MRCRDIKLDIIQFDIGNGRQTNYGNNNVNP